MPAGSWTGIFRKFARSTTGHSSIVTRNVRRNVFGNLPRRAVLSRSAVSALGKLGQRGGRVTRLGVSLRGRGHRFFGNQYVRLQALGLRRGTRKGIGWGQTQHRGIQSSKDKIRALWQSNIPLESLLGSLGQKLRAAKSAVYAGQQRNAFKRAQSSLMNTQRLSWKRMN